MTITKYDLVQDLIDESELTRLQASKFVDDFFEVISKELESGSEVKIAGFGNFILRNKKEREGRNPKTKESFPIAARRVVSFHTSNVLKTNVRMCNGDEEQLAQARKKFIDKKDALMKAKKEALIRSKEVLNNKDGLINDNRDILIRDSSVNLKTKSKKSNITKMNVITVTNKVVRDDVAVNE